MFLLKQLMNKPEDERSTAEEARLQMLAGKMKASRAVAKEKLYKSKKDVARSDPELGFATIGTAMSKLRQDRSPGTINGLTH